jgi:hypothetical protein
MSVSLSVDLSERTAYTHCNNNEVLLPKISITKEYTRYNKR